MLLSKRGSGCCRSSCSLCLDLVVRSAKTRDVKANLELGAVIAITSYDSVGFTKIPSVSEAGQHNAADSSVSAHDLAILIRLIWSGPVMFVGVPTSNFFHF